MGPLLQRLGSCRNLSKKSLDELILIGGNASGVIISKNAHDAIVSKIWNRSENWFHYILWKWDLAPKLKLFT